jgi:hypothetical protein
MDVPVDDQPQLRTTETRIAEWPTVVHHKRIQPQFRRLYYVVRSLQIAGAGSADHLPPLVLQFVAAMPKEGVTTVASGFALAAEFEQPGPILLLDCFVLVDDRHHSATDGWQRRRYFDRGGAPPSLWSAFRRQTPLRGCTEMLHSTSVSKARLGDEPVPVTALGEMFQQLRCDFSLVILDCPPLSLATKAAAVAGLCDASILVVDNDSTSREHARAAMHDVTLHGGKLIGLVANRCRYRPRAYR